MDKTLIFNFAAAMLSIVNPFGNLPLFISYTAGERKQVRNWLAVFIAVTVLVLLTIFLILGTELLIILNGLANATVGLINPEVTR